MLCTIQFQKNTVAYSFIHPHAKPLIQTTSDNPSFGDARRAKSLLPFTAVD